MAFDPIEAIIADMRAGKMVILVDDEDRENEGDLIMAAGLARAEDINFMAKFGRGLICMTLTQERCQQLRLPLMVNHNRTPHATNFTLSIEAAQGVTTGISAADRATTIRAAVAPQAKPDDILQPGHVFPLMARPGGVLTRAGHTEAGCDLAKLAGLEPAAVIVEILNEDGTMARRPDLETFAVTHGLKIGTIAALIHYRTQTEATVERFSECVLPTAQGIFQLYGYQEVYGKEVHLALVHGVLSPEQPPLVRVHMLNPLCDIFGTQRSECGRWSLADVMARVQQEPSGVVVVLRTWDNPRALADRLEQFRLQDAGFALAREEIFDLRTHGVGAQILRDLGVRKMRLLAAPVKMHGLSGFDLEIVDYVTA